VKIQISTETPVNLDRLQCHIHEDSDLPALILGQIHQPAFINTVMNLRVRWFILLCLVLPSSTYVFTVGVEVFFVMSLDYAQTHATVGKTPLDEGSALRRDLYLTTQTLYKTNIHAPGGIRIHDPSKRSTADQRRRPRGRGDRLVYTVAAYLLYRQE
jgi:hypothetical protein